MSVEHNRTTLDPLSPTLGIELPRLARRAAVTAVPDPVRAAKPPRSASGGLVQRRWQHITWKTNGSNYA